MKDHEIRQAAKDYVQLCVDEIADEAYEYAEDELDLSEEQADHFYDLVRAAKVHMP